MLFVITFGFITIIASGGGNDNDGGNGGGEISDITAPTPGNHIAFSDFTPTSLTITWGAGTDDRTDQSGLSYKLVKASSAEAIDTAEESDLIQGSDLLIDWSLNDSCSHTVSGLTKGTEYYFAVLV